MSFQVAVIDRGVEVAHRKLTKCSFDGVVILEKDGKVSRNDRYFEDDTGHGTAIAGIIHSIVPDQTLIAVKLHTEEDALNELLLLEGIKWCLDQPNIKIINISLGIATNKPNPELDLVCKEASRRGKIIVAAVHNVPGFECYPAFFPEVIAVSTGIANDKLDYGFLDQSHINVLAKGTTKRLLWKDNGYKITSGNSFAAAHFSGTLAKMLQEEDWSIIDNKSLLELIKRHASNDVYELQYIKRAENAFVPNEKSKNLDALGEELFHGNLPFPNVGRLAITGISEKEMKTVIEFEELCPFEIALLIDYPRSILDTRNINGSGVRVQKKMEDEDLNKYDTMVMGYFLDQLFDANIIFSINLLKRSLGADKNLVLWDENVHQLALRIQSNEFPDYQGVIYCPTVGDDLFEDVINYRFYDHNVPAIAVVGTGNTQGKITTQLTVKQVLSNAGYRVGHVATEPQAALLGADFLFPYGHNSNVFLEEEKWGRFIDAVTNGIARYQSPQIILSGTQGLTIPRVTHKIADFSSMHFLSGIRPDAFICTVSPEDPVEIIENLLNVMRVYYDAKPLFLAMTPKMRSVRELKGKRFVSDTWLKEEEFEAKASELTEKLHIPVINIKDERNKPLILREIQNFFK
ncbi:MAG: S8 family serine peptidase [Cytophagales bacterium]|nr:S8 family serine peptidase [Cytophagales bacterium]